MQKFLYKNFCSETREKCDTYRIFVLFADYKFIISTKVQNTNRKVNFQTGHQ